MRRPRPPLVPFLFGALAGVVTSLAVGRLKGGGPPPLARVDTPLDRVNDDFHASYDDARAQAELDAPVFIILADTLVLFRRKERQAFSFTPRLFHVIKSAAHGPAALYAALHRLGDAPIDPETGARLATARRADKIAMMEHGVSRSLVLSVSLSHFLSVSGLGWVGG